MRYEVNLHERMFSVMDTESGTARASINSPRGCVKGLSSKSRVRLIKLLAKINRPDEPVFVTLTYRDFTDDFESWKADLKRFVDSFRYHFPQLAGVWRLEFQQRGAPHYHCLLWLGQESTVAEVERQARTAWLNAIDQHSDANHEHGVTVEPVTEFRRSAFYISVYQAKDAQDRTDIQTGREWGVWGRERLGLQAIETVRLCANGLRLFRRLCRRAYIAHQRTHGRRVGNFARALRRDQPFTAFMPYGEARRVLMWCASNVDEILERNIQRAQLAASEPMYV